MEESLEQRNTNGLLKTTTSSTTTTQVCAGNTSNSTTRNGSSYSCTGHRDVRTSVAIDRTIAVGNSIDSGSLTQLMNLIKNEIDARKSSAMYTTSANNKTARLNNIQTNYLTGKISDSQGSLISTTTSNQINSLSSSLVELYNVCNNINSAFNIDSSHSEVQYQSSGTKTASTIRSGNQILASQYNTIVDALKNAMKDCICYSDCNSYLACSCNTQIVVQRYWRSY